MKVLSFLFFVLTALNAQAVSLDFSFDVNSSSASIYPCDAGIRHEAGAGQVCYDRRDGQSCNPANICNTNASCDCVCTGATGGNVPSLDTAVATTAAWTENGVGVGNNATVTRSVSAKTTNANQFTRLFTGLNEWSNQLTSLSFNLGSAKYGAEYFLDVCYRGPQIEYFQAFGGAPSASIPAFKVKLSATSTTLASSTSNYETTAGLKVRSEIHCDQQGQGSHPNAHNGSGVYGVVAHQLTMNPDDAASISGASWQKVGQYVTFNPGQVISLSQNDWVVNYSSATMSTAFVPRFCKVRYFFKETKTTARQWANQNARICTSTDITETF